MRIAVLLTDLLDRVGGIQSFNRSLVKALDEIGRNRGWDVRVLALNDRGSRRISERTHHEGFEGNRVRFSWAGLAEARKADVVI